MPVALMAAFTLAGKMVESGAVARAISLVKDIVGAIKGDGGDEAESSIAEIEGIVEPSVLAQTG